MKKAISAMIVVLFLSVASTAIAKDCVYDGKTYKPGSKVGPLTCQEDGTWK